MMKKIETSQGQVDFGKTSNFSELLIFFITYQLFRFQLADKLFLEKVKLLHKFVHMNHNSRGYTFMNYIQIAESNSTLTSKCNLL